MNFSWFTDEKKVIGHIFAKRTNQGFLVRQGFDFGPIPLPNG